MKQLAVSGWQLAVGGICYLLSAAPCFAAFTSNWCNEFWDTPGNTNEVIAVGPMYIADDPRSPTNVLRVCEHTKWGYLSAFSAFFERGAYMRSFSGVRPDGYYFQEPVNLVERLRQYPLYFKGGGATGGDVLSPALGILGNMDAFVDTLWRPGVQADNSTTARLIAVPGGRIMDASWLRALKAACARIYLREYFGDFAAGYMINAAPMWPEVPWTSNPAALEAQYATWSSALPRAENCRIDDWKLTAPGAEFTKALINRLWLQFAIDENDFFTGAATNAAGIDCYMYTDMVARVGAAAAPIVTSTNATLRLSYAQWGDMNNAISPFESAYEMGNAFGIPWHGANPEAEPCATNAPFKVQERTLEAGAGASLGEIPLIVEGGDYGRITVHVPTKEELRDYCAEITDTEDEASALYQQIATADSYTTNSLSDAVDTGRYHFNPGSGYKYTATSHQTGYSANIMGTMWIDYGFIYESLTNCYSDICSESGVDIGSPEPGTLLGVYAGITLYAGDSFMLQWHVATNGVPAGNAVDDGPYPIRTEGEFNASFGGVFYNFSKRGYFAFTAPNSPVLPVGGTMAGLVDDYCTNGLVTTGALAPLHLAAIDRSTTARDDYDGYFRSNHVEKIGVYYRYEEAEAYVASKAARHASATRADFERVWGEFLDGLNVYVADPARANATLAFGFVVFTPRQFRPGEPMRIPNFPLPAETMPLDARAEVSCKEVVDNIWGYMVYTGQWYLMPGSSAVWETGWDPALTVRAEALIDPHTIHTIASPGSGDDASNDPFMLVQEYYPEDGATNTVTVTNEWLFGDTGFLGDFTGQLNDPPDLGRATNTFDNANLVAPFIIRTGSIEVMRADFEWQNLLED